LNFVSEEILPEVTKVTRRLTFDTAGVDNDRSADTPQIEDLLVGDATLGHSPVEVEYVTQTYTLPASPGQYVMVYEDGTSVVLEVPPIKAPEDEFVSADQVPHVASHEATEVTPVEAEDEFVSADQVPHEASHEATEVTPEEDEFVSSNEMSQNSGVASPDNGCSDVEDTYKDPSYDPSSEAPDTEESDDDLSSVQSGKVDEEGSESDSPLASSSTTSSSTANQSTAGTSQDVQDALEKHRAELVKKLTQIDIALGKVGKVPSKVPMERKATSSPAIEIRDNQ
jgi:hypothetical protein